jgi:hypothetical protein
MLRIGYTILSTAVLLGGTSLALGQGYSDSTRNYHFQLEQYAKNKKEENDRANVIIEQAIKSDSTLWAPPVQAPSGTADRSEVASFITKFAGIATAFWTLALLQDLFMPSGVATSARVPITARPDPAIERWLEDPRNRSGVPYRFDTPDGKISKVCIRPFPGAQTVVYRWNAPNDLARATDIKETPSREHIQFTHPTADGLFIYVTHPAPNHQPSDKIYWLAAHRIGTTGCGHAQAYQIVYHKYGGAAEFESVTHAQRVRHEEPVENLPAFTRTCQAHHGQAACVCLAFPLMRAIPDLPNREYNRDEIRATLAGQPRLLAEIAQRCKVQF